MPEANDQSTPRACSTACAPSSAAVGPRIDDPPTWRPIWPNGAAAIPGSARRWCCAQPPRRRSAGRGADCAPRPALPIVPQGGNTGLVGGSIPSADGARSLISLARMNRIRAIDPINNTITVEAGCVLARRCSRRRRDADRLFPLSLGAEGTCQIGGNLSTNAGGMQVLRYGNARDLVLGLEVVLPDGHGLERPARPAQGQHRLRPEAAVHRRRGHARHHHRRRAASCSRGRAQIATAFVARARARGRDRFSLREPAGRQRRPRHRLRADAAHRPRLRRCGTSPGTRDPLPARIALVRADGARRRRSGRARGGLRAHGRGGPRARRWRRGWSRTPTLAASEAQARAALAAPRDHVRGAEATRAAASSTTSRCRSRASPTSSPRATAARRSAPCPACARCRSAMSATATSTSTSASRSGMDKAGLS